MRRRLVRAGSSRLTSSSRHGGDGGSGPGWNLDEWTGPATMVSVAFLAAVGAGRLARAAV